MGGAFDVFFAGSEVDLLADLRFIVVDLRMVWAGFVLRRVMIFTSNSLWIIVDKFSAIFVYRIVFPNAILQQPGKQKIQPNHFLMLR